MQPTIELGLFGDDERALRGVAEQAERALRAYTTLSSVQRGGSSGGVPATTALNVTPGAFSLGGTLPVEDKGLAKGITGGMQAFGAVQNIASGAAFSSAAGAAGFVASLKEPLEKLLPDSRLAQQFAMAAPAIPIAIAGIGVAQRSYDSTMAANATEKQISRRYGLGVYGQATYEYGLAARRRGVFSDTPATAAMASLENASRVVSTNGRTANLAAVNKALEASRSVGGGRNVALSGGLGASIEAMASAAVMEGGAPVAQDEYRASTSGGEMLAMMQQRVSNEALRLGRELSTTERQHYYREALAGSTQSMPQEAREKFFESIEKSEREETFNPISAKAQYQQKMRNMRAAAYGRLGAVPDIGTPDRNARGARGEAGPSGDKTIQPAIDEDEPELTPQGARAMRRAQGVAADQIYGRYQDKQEVPEIKPADGRRARGNGIYSDEQPDTFKPPDVVKAEAVGKPAAGWTTQFGAGRGYKPPVGKLED